MFHIIKFTVFEEIHCDKIVEPHLRLDTGLTEFGTAVLMTCDLGYKFMEQSVERVDLITNDTFITKCEGDGHWSPAIPSCQGQDNTCVFVIFVRLFSLAPPSIYQHL